MFFTKIYKNKVQEKKKMKSSYLFLFIYNKI